MNVVLIQEAVTSMASSAIAYASKKEGKFTIDQVMEAVIACGADHETNEHYIAIELFVKKEQREMFMTLPTDDIRFKWLSRKYMTSMETRSASYGLSLVSCNMFSFAMFEGLFYV